MMSKYPFLCVANWKMYGFRESIIEFTHIIKACKDIENLSLMHNEQLIENRELAGERESFSDKEIVMCVPATLTASFSDAMPQGLSCISLGGQNCHIHNEGAYTGSISASMLVDSGANYVLLGHSEVRQVTDTNKDVRMKIHVARQVGLRPIICVGEQKIHREKGLAVEAVIQQLEECLDSDFSCHHGDIAYEPIWAIGAEEPPSIKQIAQMHDAITQYFRQKNVTNVPRILYGGAVNEKNVADITNIPSVRGVLVGRASLKASQFLKIVNQC